MSRDLFDRDPFENFDRESKKMAKRFGIAAVGIILLNLALLAGAVAIVVLVLRALGVL